MLIVNESSAAHYTWNKGAKTNINKCAVENQITMYIHMYVGIGIDINYRPEEVQGMGGWVGGLVCRCSQWMVGWLW